MFIRILLRTYQEFLWILLRLYLILSGSSTRGQVRLKPGFGYILAANHRSQLDPFFISAALPLPVYHHLSPVRFMAYRNLFKNIFLRFLLRMSGAFPTKPIHNLPYGLEYSTRVLENGGTICIFPEGKRARPGSVEPRRGVAELAKIDKVELIPVWLEWERGLILRKVHIVIGKPQRVSGLNPSQIMQIIYDLGSEKQPITVVE